MVDKSSDGFSKGKGERMKRRRNSGESVKRSKNCRGKQKRPSRVPLPPAPLHSHPFLTREELAELLKVDRRVVQLLIARGELPYLNIGPRVARFRLEDVQQALTRNCLRKYPNAERGTRNDSH